MRVTPPPFSPARPSTARCEEETNQRPSHAQCSMLCEGGEEEGNGGEEEENARPGVVRLPCSTSPAGEPEAAAAAARATEDGAVDCRPTVKSPQQQQQQQHPRERGREGERERGGGEREKEREGERQRKREMERGGEKERERGRDRGRERWREGERGKEGGDRGRERDGEGREGKREGEREKQREWGRCIYGWRKSMIVNERKRRRGEEKRTIC